MQSLSDDAQCLPASTYCPFCVDDHELHVVQEPDAVDSFSLNNLLSVGTIPVAVHDSGPPCPSKSDNRDWYLLPTRTSHPVDTLFRELAFLSKHLFLRATCQLGASGQIIFVRVYLIPNDLPNVHGQLHLRPETVVKKAQVHLSNILPLIVQSDRLWEASEGDLNAPQKYFFPNNIDNRTMAEIYSDLPSPVLGPLTNDSTKLSHRVASGDSIWGLRTSLYGYQRHSVAIMLHRESSTSLVPDPSYIPVSTMSGTRLYIKPSTMSVLQERPVFSPSRSGILCEELGTGKTVMVIALALVSASGLADAEESMCEHLVMTPLAYRHFPSTEHALARDKAGFSRKTIRQVPSLVEILIHCFSLKTALGRPAFADELEATHMWPFIQANKAFYHLYDPRLTADRPERLSRRVPPKLSPRTMYLSSATLVIVPLTLLGQWKTEIDKHCHDHIRYLIVRPSTDLPNARKLASGYELVVMCDSRFRSESKRNKIEKLYDLKSCTCPCLPGFRIPNCQCPGDPEVTPLLQVRWKRLVIDEGHNTSNLAAVINHLVKQLSIQHKWIVTGTPTSNMLGLKLGHRTDEELELVYPEPDSLVAMSQTRTEGQHVRIWGNYDRLNLRKLGSMIGVFLSVPPFHNDSKLKGFLHDVAEPLCDLCGPRPGAIDVLSQVMQLVMVRHRIEDVEDDVVLPPMRHDVIYMKLDSYALKSYNAMQAALAINAIDSEREGIDYLFHPSKAQDLQATINNSSQGLFWSASDILYNVDEICRLADKYVARAVRRLVGPEDVDLLQRALENAAIAAKDKLWRAMQPHPDVPFRVSGLDADVFEAWTRSGLRDSSRPTDIMHPDRLMNLRSLVQTKPWISREELIVEGNLLDRNEKRTMDSKSVGPRKTKRVENQTKEMAKEVQGTIQALRERIERMHTTEEEEPEGWDRKIKGTSIGARVTEPSLLSGVQVGPSLSTKLNYIISEVQRYSEKEKFLIFSNSLLTLFQIGEALSLFEIKYLRYTNEEKYLLREQCITTFETSDVYRVFLMDLKLGARGLNLISASRIIFCEPVWHPDVESQAIKRAHRIGQTRPVTVKTLVIRSTAEEAMIVRRQYLRTSDKVPSMTTESGMRDYLQNPCFLTESAAYDTVDVHLSLDGRATSVHTQSNSSDSCEGSSGRINVDSDVLTRGCEGRGGDVIARKRVRFDM